MLEALVPIAAAAMRRVQAPIHVRGD